MSGDPRYLIVDPDHRRACARCGSVVAGGEFDHHDRFHAELDTLARHVGPVPAVMVPADAYERLRMLATQLDSELRAVRALLEMQSARLLRRELLTLLARADYWYDMWIDARGPYDAPEWRERSEPRVGVDEARLRATTRADVWAEEFAKVRPDVDQGLMIAWFANAIETGRNAGASSVAVRREES